MYRRRSSSSTILPSRSRTLSASNLMRFSASSGRSNNTSSSRVVMTVWSRRSPMFSMRSLALAAMRAISLMPSCVNSSVAPSAAHRAAYCLVRAFSGSVMMRTKSASVSGCSSTRIGKRPWSSGIRSEGLVAWNAPVALHAFARHVRPDGAPLPRDLVDLVDEDHAVVLDAVERLVHHVVHVDELFQLLVDQDAPRLVQVHGAALFLLGQHLLQQLGEVDVRE